jgi:hypothetical protein
MERRQAITLTAALGTVLGIASVYWASLVHYGGEPSFRALHLYSATFSLLVACAVDADRRGRTVGSSYEYGAFVFFLWPLMLPVYLFKTRHWSGLVGAVGVIALFYMPWLVALIAYWWLGADGA